MEKERKVILVIFFLAVCLILSSCGVFMETIPAGKILSPESNDHFVTINDIRYHYREYPGAGTDILLIHGFGSSTYTWEQVAPILSDAGYHVWALDMKGFGWSDKPRGDDYDPVTLAKEVNTWLKVMGIERPVLVGNSLGGMIGIIMAVDHPENVDRLILIDAHGYHQKKPLIIRVMNSGLGAFVTKWTFGKWLVKGNLDMVFFDRKLVTDERIDAYYDRLRTEGARDAQTAVSRAIMEYATDPYIEKLSVISAPTLIIWGEEDHWIPVEHGYQFQKDIPGADLKVIPECGHIPQEERPETTAQLIQAFVK
ncbi:MAG: alpha/beta hydrolase [Deltaproteobacteria bacterium]|nr:alpha/beta hydrolase [Deltaproteobacteria bacterium]MBN2844568.1 alpha/beta hydrolase [Deltaproteobacteria bacterium]